MKLLIIIISLLFSLGLNAQKLTLELKENKTVYYVEEAIKLSLTISDLDTKLKVDSFDAVSVIDFTKFKKEIVVIASNTGDFIIGPYFIELKGKKIKSNEIRIKIVERNLIEEHEKGITIEVPKNVVKGDKFIIKIVSPKALTVKENDRDGYPKVTSIRIKDNKYIKKLETSVSSTTSVINGVVKSEFTYIFTVLATKKGELVINKGLFIPELDIDFEKNIKIKKQ